MNTNRKWSNKHKGVKSIKQTHGQQKNGQQTEMEMEQQAQGGGLVESKQTKYHSQVRTDRDGDKTEQGRKSLTQHVIATGLPGSKKAKAKSEGNRTKLGQVGVRARPKTTYPTTNQRHSSLIGETQGQIAWKYDQIGTS